MTEEAKKATAAGVCIHYLQYGQTPCGMAGVPRDWPEGHVWVRDWEDVNCRGCLSNRPKDK